MNIAIFIFSPLRANGQAVCLAIRSSALLNWIVVLALLLLRSFQP